MNNEELAKLERMLVNTRYSKDTIGREAAISLVNEVIKQRNGLAAAQGLPLPFPPKVEEVKREREPVGFDGPK